MPFTLFNTLGTLLIGITVGLMLYAVTKTFKLTLPKWIFPTAIGASMIAFQVYNDATWFSRTAGDLPPTHVVVGRFSATSPLRPWTYVLPVHERFQVIDRASARRNPDVPDLVLVDLLLVTRFQPTLKAPQFFDCAGNRRADAHEGVRFAADGTPQGVDWEALPADDPMLAAACAPLPAPTG
ncbi:hypothetical protein [Mongoliimonas terrestris]|uniref:hypothetical protein n=1 Tax=Mongoliimonas terrestris TaxID=1709001 RepID=UPI00094995F4|nr:hypothetical protein [Mongoliimonas terrestris]